MNQIIFVSLLILQISTREQCTQLHVSGICAAGQLIDGQRVCIIKTYYDEETQNIVSHFQVYCKLGQKDESISFQLGCETIEEAEFSIDRITVKSEIRIKEGKKFCSITEYDSEGIRNCKESPPNLDILEVDSDQTCFERLVEIRGRENIELCHRCVEDDEEIPQPAQPALAQTAQMGWVILMIFLRVL